MCQQTAGGHVGYCSRIPLSKILASLKSIQKPSFSDYIKLDQICFRNHRKVLFEAGIVFNTNKFGSPVLLREPLQKAVLQFC